jgi:hypothetical protein
MAASKLPGPTCQVANWFAEPIDRGTSALIASPRPGPTSDPLRGLGQSPKEKLRASSSPGFGPTSGESFFPEFSDSEEPPRARREYTTAFRERASRELPHTEPIFDFQGLDMGGHIANLRDLLSKQAIVTDLIKRGSTVEVLAHAPFERVRAVLRDLYYHGLYTNNLIDHRGGQEFRNWASQGFHMKVVYPPVFGPDNGPTRIGDLHLDKNNPIDADPEAAKRHMEDFFNTKRGNP